MSYVVLFVILVIFLVIVALLLTEKGKRARNYVHFISVGLDSGFTLAQILFLGRIGKLAEIEDLTALFWSVPTLDRCTAEIVRRSRHTGTANDPDTQRLLSSLYKWRTKIELEQSKKRRGLETTKDIVAGQRIRILLRGVGVFSSRVTRNNAKDLVIEYPVGSVKNPVSSIDWVNRTISVYFWRQDDAGYVFDTIVLPGGAMEGKAILSLAHSGNLIRSQKRKSVRAKCSVYAQLYLVKPGEPLDTALEPEPGMKCLIEDISEDGAMVVIGGKAMKDMQIKIQFMIHDVLIVMAGTIRAVEFNRETNQSRIHFESGELNPRMKNAILTFVYNVLPEEEKERLDAIRLTEEDGLADSRSTASPAASSPSGRTIPKDASVSVGGKSGSDDTIEELPTIPDSIVK